MKAKLVYFHLTKIYRQKNVIDGNILSRIRLGTQSDEDLERINSNITDDIHPEAVVLCVYRNKAVWMNRQMMEKCNGKPLFFEEERTKNCKLDSIYPPVIDLKQGCRVVIKRNGSCKSEEGHEISYVNGNTGTLLGLDKRDRLMIRRDDGELILLGKYKNENVKYIKTTRREETEEGEYVEVPVIEQVKKGYVKQYPISAGYSQTIHSSQGATINRVHVVLGSGRPFCPNLLYVALSRVTSLDRLSLNRKITHEDIWTTLKDIPQAIQQYEMEDLDK